MQDGKAAIGMGCWLQRYRRALKSFIVTHEPCWNLQESADLTCQAVMEVAVDELEGGDLPAHVHEAALSNVNVAVHSVQPGAAQGPDSHLVCQLLELLLHIFAGLVCLQSRASGLAADAAGL